VIAGWPAFALLVAVKLLSGMLEHRHGADRLAGTQDRPVPVQDRLPAADVGGDDHGMAGDGPGTITAAVAGTAAHAGTGADPETGTLLPAARAARDRVLGRGDSLTRDSLAAELRRDGHPVRNARISQLLTALKLESCEAPGAQATEEPPPVGAGQSRAWR
jgi:hypothetical protein